MAFEFRKIFNWKNQNTLGGTADPGFQAWQPTKDQEYVTIETAEENMAVYRAVKLISHDLGRLPVSVEGGDFTSSLAEYPNDRECWFDFCRKHIRYLMLYGNSYALISRDGYGEVQGLISCTPQEIHSTAVEGGEGKFVYRHNVYGDLQPSDVMHWRVQGSRPFVGTSPIVEAARALNLAKVQEDAGEVMFRTPGLGKLAISSPESISHDMRTKLRNEFERVHGKTSGHAMPIITQGGMDVSQVGQSLSESEWITARRFSVGEVARLYSVPPSFLCDLDKSTLENSAAQMKSYVSTCLSHWSAIFNAEFMNKLGSCIKWDTKNLLQGTLKETTESLRMAVDAGMMTPNECREQLGLEPHPDGDDLLVSKNYQQAGVNGTDTDAGSESIEEDPTQEASDKD